MAGARVCHLQARARAAPILQRTPFETMIDGAWRRWSVENFHSLGVVPEPRWRAFCFPLQLFPFAPMLSSLPPANLSCSLALSLFLNLARARFLARPAQTLTERVSRCKF